MNEKLLEIINTVLENKGKPRLEKLYDEIHLRDDIGFDSLDLAELTVRIESEFGIDIFEETIVNTVGEIKEKLESNI